MTEHLYGRALVGEREGEQERNSLRDKVKVGKMVEVLIARRKRCYNRQR